jgi:AraC family transcriptional regulator of adaptative response / DNA-3-methyladenine glycosylase II
MRVLGCPDAFPHTDHCIKKRMNGRSPKETLALAETWCLWRSYATMSMWNSA